MMTEDLSVLSRPGAAPDASLRYGADPDQVADLRLGSRAAELPLLVFIHGGFWKPEYDRQHAAALSTALAQAGWSVLTLEYRRIPGQAYAMLDDVRAALSQLPGQISQHNGEMLVCGHSAGGHLALWVASQLSGVRAALALAPAADLQMAHELDLGEAAVRRFLGCEPAQCRDIDPMHIAAPACPVVIVQGQQDEIVPPALAISYCAKFPQTRLVQLNECGHFALIDPLSSAWPAVIRELGRLSPNQTT